MTPIIAVVVAVVAGLLCRRPGAAAGLTVGPVLGAIVAQSWYLGSGRGSNTAAETVGSGGYWAVQVVTLVLASAIAAGLCAVLARRRAVPPSRLASRQPRVILVGLATLAAATATAALMFALDRPSRPGSGTGGVPAAGILGMALAATLLALLVGLWLQARRRSSADG